MAKSLKVEIIGEAKGLSSELKKASAETEGFGSKLSAMAGPAAAGAAAVGIAVVTETLTKSVEAAMKEQEAIKGFDAAVKAVGGSLPQWSAQMEKTNEAGRKLGFTNEDTTATLRKFVSAGDNVKQSVQDMGFAEDLARTKHIQLAAAADQVNKLHAGATRLLKEFGIQATSVTTNVDQLKLKYKALGETVPPLELAHAKLADKMAAAAKNSELVEAKVRGQAKAYSETAAGGMAVFSAQLDNLEVKLGNKLLPVLTKIIAFINQNFPTIEATIGTVMDAVGKAIESIEPYLKAVMQALKGVIEVIKGLMTGDWSMVWKGIKDIAAGYLNALKAYVVLETKAILAVVSAAWNAIKALTAPAWNAIKQAVITVWNAIRSAATTTWNAIKNAIVSAINTTRTAVVGAWNTIRGAVVGVWNALRSSATSSWNAIKNAIQSAVNATRSTVMSVWNSIRGSVVGVWNSLRSTASSVWNGIKGAVSGAVSGIQGVLNGLISVVRAVAGAFQSAWNIISSIVSKIQGAVSAAKSAVSSLPGGGIVSGVAGALGFKEGGLVPRFQHGGLSPGEIPAVLHRGEYVLRADAVRAIGPGVLDSLNALTPLSRTGAVSVVGAAIEGGGAHVHFHGGTFIGGNPEGVARALAPAITRQLNRSSRRGGM